jgi:hypothetical protein
VNPNPKLAASGCASSLNATASAAPNPLFDTERSRFENLRRVKGNGGFGGVEDENR